MARSEVTALGPCRFSCLHEARCELWHGHEDENVESCYTFSCPQYGQAYFRGRVIASLPSQDRAGRESFLEAPSTLDREESEQLRQAVREARNYDRDDEIPDPG